MDPIKEAAAKLAATKQKLAEEARASKEEPAKPGEAGPYTAIVNTAKMLKKELFDDSQGAMRAEPYAPPVDRRRDAVERKLRRSSRILEEDKDATGIVLHQDSAWQSQWKNFKDNSKVVNSLFSLRLKYEESENPLIRAFRSLADNVTDKLGGVFEEGEMAQTMAEIARVDPSFEKEKFMFHCEKTVIPAVLEAYMAADKKTLRDWCSEGCFSFLSARIDDREAQGLKFDSKILDIRNVELLLAKIMDGNPVLIMSFMAQQLNCVRDSTGAIKEGGEDKIERVFYVFAMRRNQNELDPLLAWEVMEIGVQASMETW